MNMKVREEKAFANMKNGSRGILPKVSNYSIGNSITIRDIIPEDAVATCFPNEPNSYRNNRMSYCRATNLRSTNRSSKCDTTMKGEMIIKFVANQSPIRLSFWTKIKPEVRPHKT